MNPPKYKSAEVRDALETFLQESGKGAIKAVWDYAGISTHTLWRFRNGTSIKIESLDKIAEFLIERGHLPAPKLDPAADRWAAKLLRNETPFKKPPVVAETPEQYTLEREYPINQPEVLKEIDKTLVQMLKAVRKSDTCTNAQLGVVRGGVDYLKDVLVPEAQELINAGNQNKPKPHTEP